MEHFCLCQSDTTVALNGTHQLTFSTPTQNYCQFKIRKEELQAQGQALFIAQV